MKHKLAWAAYTGFGLAYTGLWHMGVIRPGGNRWHPERGGEHLVRADHPLWLHAASLGEVQVAAAYAAHLPADLPLYLTVQTEAGKNAAADRFAGDRVGYAPVDLDPPIERFLERIRPRGLVVFETEIWPRWLQIFSGPVWFANARLSERSCRRLSRLKFALTPLWHNVRVVLAQSESDARRFVHLGMGESRVEVAGQIKQFLSEPAVDAKLRDSWRARLGIGVSEFLIVGGSIREDEIDPVVRMYTALRASGAGARLVLAPRHLHYTEKVLQTLKRAGFEAARVTQATGQRTSVNVFVLDTHGELGGLYAASDLALIGGTIAPHGGHNPNEPARFGVPVITGPHTGNIEGDLALLSSAGLAFRLENLADFPILARELSKTNRARSCAHLARLLKTRAHPGERLARALGEEGLRNGRAEG